ncbi:hypothetical protein H0H81_007536 [Sphagnurus paluster]|uniref:Helicase ATP-binding domain-containing protein n=1 Tax=Sphagnurus paluster TaxID=117069 RepID=A0A9P7K3C8_9AGAR|nr:hypothetical protein H0H81_007536 [Sphagnurus paluster]
MPPRRGIVKSGNAGNSSKADKTPSAPVPEGPNPIFPAGSKHPLSLLQERCQKLGWEKPSVETHKRLEGWAFVVYISKINKKTNTRESIKLVPEPEHLSPTALEARHWGATYALHRFCNGIQLHLVLPPGPRDYWNELVIEQKNCPPHLKWKYAADPFLAQEEARAKAEKREATSTREANSSKPSYGGHTSNEFAEAPEVKMATSLREQVEDAIKKGLTMYPEADAAANFILDNAETSKISKDLGHLGFVPSQIRKAIDFLSKPSRLASSLLESLTPLEACIEFLVLHIPECDLPRRFLPTTNSSNPFITSAHSGTENLKQRWVNDKAVKEAGWPAHTVKEYTDNPKLLQNWDLLLVALGKRLIGEEWIDGSEASPDGVFDIQIDEVEAMGASVVDPTELVIPLFSAPIQIHILTSPEKVYPRPSFAPMYITSTSTPAYVRLHLLSSLLLAMRSDNFLEPEEGFCMAVMRILEAEWAKIEDNGPPEMSAVLGHFISEPQSSTRKSDIVDTYNIPPNRQGRRRGAPRRDKRTDQQIRHEFEKLCQQDQYVAMLKLREKLPAFAAKEDFLRQLEDNRVVVVVGETVPQFILDNLIASGKGSTASILVTQPRRISAISVATRVSAERLEDGSVGYAIRGESKQTEKTKLLFCTTGVVLRRLGSGDTLDDAKVHERSVDGDFLLLELKELLKKHLDLKVILMSATINHETFVKYFSGAPLLSIPGFTHPVIDRYLEDLIPLIQYQPSAHNSSKKQTGQTFEKFQDEYKSVGQKHPTSSSHSSSNNIKLVATVVDYIMSTGDTYGGILIFLPGVQEIRACIDTMRPFFAVDAGKVKETQYDSENSLSRLVETWVTRAAARQRRGRAGRTQPGVCYKLYTRKQELNMAKFPVPEILRVPLESISLMVKVTREEEDVKHFLSRAIDPPKIADMEKAWSVLEELGAVDASDLGFIPRSSIPSTPALNKNSGNMNLVKALILGGLWPRVARVHLPANRIKFDKVQAGTIQRENTAKEYKIFDLREGRVFLHPGSVLFGEAAWKSPFLVYFHKHMSSKVFLRDATEVRGSTTRMSHRNSPLIY